jgi:hypothetical protein
MYRIFLFFITLVLLSACKEQGTQGSSDKVLPTATGGVDEIMFVLPDHLYTEKNVETIEESFFEIFQVLPQPEQRFKISTVKASQMNSLLFRFRNTIFISSYDSDDNISKLLEEALNEEELSAAKNLYVKRNIWARNQLVFFLLADKYSDIPSVVASKADFIKNTISNNELSAYKSLAYINGVNVKLRDQLKQHYGISFDVPVNMKIAENEGSFVSFRGDTEKSTYYLFFDVINFSEPISDENKGIAMRDARGHYVSTNLPNTYMASDSTLGFFTIRKERNGLIIYENRGLWTMKNDFMGGPFINHYVIDKENNRAILLDGFVYGPGDKNKQKLIRQFEAIFATLDKVSS